MELPAAPRLRQLMTDVPWQEGHAKWHVNSSRMLQQGGTAIFFTGVCIGYISYIDDSRIIESYFMINQYDVHNCKLELLLENSQTIGQLT